MNMGEADNLVVSISRLVAVDSADVAIAELDISEGGILIGGGNIGKTSLLNAIRLFLLPEENFRKSAKKFGFADKEGNFYSDDESFEHYFPSANSFLILECNNYLGGHLPHCQILYRGGTEKLDYKRLFTSLSYAQIRDLFWDQSKGEDGIGGKADGLTPAQVIKSLKREDKHFKQATRSAKIKDLIYANQLLDIDAMRYCLFPLNRTDDAHIDAFRALVRLLFDMKTGSDTVRLAVANIIESLKKERKDELAFDIDGFIATNDELGNKERQLNHIKHLQPQFDALAEQYQHLRLNQGAETALMQFTMMAQQAKSTLAREVGDDEKLLARLQSQLSQAKSDIRAAEQSIIVQQAEVTSAEKGLSKLQKQRDDSELVFNQYGQDATVDDVVENLAAYKEEKQQSLTNREDANERAKQMAALEREISLLSAKKQSLEESLKHQQFSLRKQLSEQEWDRLAALNKTLALANPQRALTDGERTAIQAFVELATPVDGGFEWFGEYLPLNQWQGALDGADARLALIAEELQDKQGDLDAIIQIQGESKFAQIKEIEQLKREIERTGEDINLVKRHDYVCSDIAEKQSLLAEFTAGLEKLNTSLTAKATVMNGYQQQVDDKSEAVGRKQEKLASLGALCNQAEAYLQAYSLPTSAFAVLPDPTIKLEDGELTLRKQALQLKRDARASVIEAVHQFVRDGILVDDDELSAAHLSDEQLSHAFGQLESRYQGLEQAFEILAANFREHKHTIHGIINELKNNRELVRHFERDINGAFENVAINDLARVEAKIAVEKRFEDLVAEIEHLDTHSDQKASDQFIARLKAFSQKFFPDGKAAMLTMDQIVTGITYQVKKHNQSGWITKSQSTSTIMLINLKLVEILLSRVRHSACTTYFPLVIDEGASVDSSQFDWLLPTMKEAGFRILSASTSSASSEIIFKFGRYFKLDAMRTAYPYDPVRTIAYTGEPDSFVNISSISEREQLDMFGDDNG